MPNIDLWAVIRAIAVVIVVVFVVTMTLSLFSDASAKGKTVLRDAWDADLATMPGNDTHPVEGGYGGWNTLRSTSRTIADGILGAGMWATAQKIVVGALASFIMLGIAWKAWKAVTAG